MRWLFSLCGQLLRSAGVLDKLFYFSPGHNYSYLTQYGPLECSAYFPPPLRPLPPEADLACAALCRFEESVTLPGLSVAESLGVYRSLVSTLCSPGHLGDMFQATSTNDVTFWVLHPLQVRLATPCFPSIGPSTRNLTAGALVSCVPRSGCGTTCGCRRTTRRQLVGSGTTGAHTTATATTSLTSSPSDAASSTAEGGYRAARAGAGGRSTRLAPGGPAPDGEHDSTSAHTVAVPHGAPAGRQARAGAARGMAAC